MGPHVTGRGHAHLRGCFALDVEKDFLQHLMRNIPVWTVLVALKSGTAVQSPEECGILRRLYYILCRTTAALFDDTTHHKNDDDDYLILVGASDWHERRSLTAAEREYFYPPISFDKSMMNSLTGTVGGFIQIVEKTIP